MKKRLFHFLTLICVCLCSAPLLTSCGDDDNDEPKDGDLVEKLQGTWHFERMKISVMGQNLEFTADQLKDDSGYAGFYDEVLSFSGSKVNGYDYSVDGNSLLLPWYVETGWWAQVSFSGSSMTMFYDINYQGVNMKLWSIYVKSGSRAQLAPACGEGFGCLLPHVIKSTRP